MAILALLPSPVTPFVTLDHRRHRSITSCSRSFLSSTRTLRTLASRNNWNVEVSRGFLPQTALSDVADLLASAFRASGGDDDDEDFLDQPLESSLNPMQLADALNFKFRLMAALQFRALTEGRQYITVLARSVTTGAIAGVVTVSPGLGPAGAEGHLADFPEDQTIASISNMAVEEDSRRQGLGKILLETAEVAAGDWPRPPSLYILSVYKTNEVAIQLYKNSGYAVDDTWVDPKWLYAAERGLASGLRRSLMVKKVIEWETASEDDE